MSKLIYLATPYTNFEDKNKLIEVIEDFIANKIMNSEEIIISPILHCHNMQTRYNLPTDWNFWRNYNIEILKRCDELWILHLKGWRQSKGIMQETLYAMENKIPIVNISIKK